MVLENWVDVAILFVVAAYALQGLQRGFFLALVDLLGFVLALALALRFYPEATVALQPYVPLPVALLRPVAFVGLWLLADVAIALVGRVLSAPLDALARLSSINGFFGLIPGALKGGLLAARARLWVVTGFCGLLPGALRGGLAAGLGVAFARAPPLPEPVKAQLGES